MSSAKLNRHGVATALLCTGILAGCQSNPGPDAQNMARTTLQTAPADLQLVCASAASNAAGQGTKVLPTGSQQIDAKSYSVDLDAGGRKFRCVVDDQGTVTSLLPA